MDIHPKSDYPERQYNNGLPEDFSVDVITCDEDGLLCIGFYNFDTQKWGFHSDTLVDYYEEGIPEMDFNWMYPPAELTQIDRTKSNRTQWRANQVRKSP